ncbi:acetyl-CoA carboxylase biotin carboxylase subunit family protein [Candidatus Uabimicrobium sp. HlEnr_7]|uniref:ATP-grasp domain-containing protein n=1 Tax=Candidatus Uabimicrobium helgolandensis TaxID=3095367 RepID=UPI003557A1AB
MNILVLFPNDYDIFFLTQQRFPDCNFFFEGSGDIVAHLEQFSIDHFIEKTTNKYQDIDGVICTQDYPGMLVAAILAFKWQLPTCRPETTIVLQHKYYSRLLQQECLPDNTPRFMPLSLEQNFDDWDFGFPCFIKPVKSVFSFLASRIENKEQLHNFVDKSKEQLRSFSKPFNDALKHYPQFCIDANHFIVEEVLGGLQVTLDGFSWNGDVSITGIVDSVTYPGKESFHSFEYPSKLPKQVQDRMIHMAKTFMLHTKYQQGMFNIEMFYDKDRDKIDIIEVNPRMFFAAADYFEKVDGLNTYNMCLDIAVGREPNIPSTIGKFKVAATFTPRLFEDKLVRRIPSSENIKKIKRQFPDMILKIEHKVGQKLSDTVQSTGSYKYAVLNLGGNSWGDLYQRFQEIMNMLDFEFGPLE